VKKIAIVIHDAGASQIILSIVKANFKKAYWYIFTPLNSPAAKIAIKNSLPIQTSSSLKEISPNLLFFGTSWQNSFHTEFVDYAKENNITTVAFLDNWEDYKKRFDNIFPDFICVSDELAYQTAVDEGLKKLIKIKDYATMQFLNSAKKKSIKGKNSLLILSEPTAKVAKNSFLDANYWGFTESSWVKDILNNFKLFRCSSVTIRLHPSDTPKTYEDILKDYKEIPYNIEQKSELIDDLLSSKVVIGINTVALYYASLLNKVAISYIPSKIRKSNLPIAKTNQIQSLLDFDISNFKRNDSSQIENFGIDFETLMQRLT